MTIYYTSDLHFSHANIIDYCDRPFRDPGGNPDTSHMTEVLVANWNSVVMPDDTVHIIGDLVMGRRDETLETVRRLNGIKVLTPGNHDYCHSSIKKRDTWIPKYEAVGLVIGPEQWRTTLPNGMNVQVCHFPYTGDSGSEDRYVGHRPGDDGSWLIHGHVHDTWRVNGRMINVGVDVHDFTPISEADIVRLIEEHQ